MRKSYGVRTFRCLGLALFHSLGKLPEHLASCPSTWQVARAGIVPRILLTNP
jgi:hypothetical protein